MCRVMLVPESRVSQGPWRVRQSLLVREMKTKQSLIAGRTEKKMILDALHVPITPVQGSKNRRVKTIHTTNNSSYESWDTRGSVDGQDKQRDTLQNIHLISFYAHGHANVFLLHIDVCAALPLSGHD